MKLNSFTFILGVGPGLTRTAQTGERAFTFGDRIEDADGHQYSFVASVQTCGHQTVWWERLQIPERATVPTLCIGEGR